MKKIAFIISILTLALAFSCTKEDSQITNSNSVLDCKTFVASIAKTKTTLGAGDVVKWAAGDKIDVYGINGGTVKKAVYALTTGDGSTTGTFTYESGDDLEGSTDYYAIYPSGVALSTSDLPTKIKLASAFSTGNMQSQTAVENGYDPKYAIMTANVSAGKLNFRHGACYFGVRIPGDGITKVKISLSNNALQRKPAYNASTGALNESNSGDGVIAATGTFVSGSYYYIIGYPKHDGTKLGNVTVTYTQGGVEKPITTEVIKTTAPALGTIYDLGCPPIAPTISADDVDILKTATGGNITFTVNDPVVGGVMTAATTGGKTNTISNFSLGAVGDGTIPFTCDANDGGEKKAYITLTYTYNTSKTVTKDIVITQEANVVTPHTYVFYVDSDGSRVQTQDGVAGASYFTLTGSPTNLTCSSSSYFGVDYYTILGNNYSKALKIESSKYLEFTTSAGVSSTINFYAARRQSDKAGTIKLKTGSTTVHTYDMAWEDGKGVLYSPASPIALTASTNYRFDKSGEIGLFYVVVTESLP